MAKDIEILLANGLLEKLNRGELEKTLDELDIKTKKFEKDEFIIREGERISSIYVICSGSVRAEKVYAEGDLHIIDMFEESEMFGVESAVSRTQLSPVDYICNRDAQIIGITVNSIKNSRFSRKIMESITERLADEMIKKMHKLEILAEKSLRKRIIAYLEILRNKTPGAGSDGANTSFTVKMSREQMANFLCVNRSALSNELNKMKREKIIDFEKNSFRIL